MSSFTAEANEKEVHLSWITASELNNKMFEVERKTSQTEYSTIAQIEGAGTTTEMNHYLIPIQILMLVNMFTD